MSCACRTTPLRIFVQSLTELRLSNAAVPRSAPCIQSSWPCRRPLSRPLSTTSALYRPPRQRKLRIVDDPPLPSRAEEEALLQARDEDSPASASTLQASTADLRRAKQHGAIFDYSPESIDELVANLEDDQDTVVSPPADLPLSDTAPPRTSSKLKRSKIIKADPKPQPQKKNGEDDAPPREREQWQIQKAALQSKFPEGWMPRKRLSPDALDGIRALHAQFPQQYPTAMLAAQFEVSPEAIRRILRAKWAPRPEEEEDRQGRWFNRGKSIWGQMAELGKKPPRRWRREGVVRAPYWNEKRGPRTEWPYMPRRPPAESGEESIWQAGETSQSKPKSRSEREEPRESVQRKLSETLL
ncbi:Uu.00g072470.m01.CDS01 [Anthostomella pinea]|uniref:Required for respiratory growth protein 9, mitochondrial n=1 Tax=Anthostomella pinea TaxID=933095 RepID=A0AAI8VV23_9PEZI|nr:Uu.00g072470.m01.CDS01 [Anthostomella pinea]